MSIVSESEILSRVVEPAAADLSPDAARAILGLKFNEDAMHRIDVLAKKNRLELLSDDEREEFAKYLRVGNFLNLWQSKARASLARHRAP